MEHTSPPHVAIFLSPGVGHLIPLVELAGRLVSHHRFSVTLIAHRLDSPSTIEQSLFNALPKEVNVVFFPLLPLEALPVGAGVEARMILSVTANLPRLHSLLASIASLAALVVDIFCVAAFDVAAELGIPSYLFFTSSCMVLSLGLHVPALDPSLQGELPEPVRLPGCVPVHRKDMPQPLQVRTTETYKQFLRVSRRFLEAEGIFVNSFEELEPRVIKALKEGTEHPPVYPIGPLVRSASPESDQNLECLKWLDCQPSRSVVFVSFGSGGTLSYAQTTELALGLEISGQRFLWVVKSPNDHDAGATFFSLKNSEDPLQFLPEGFLERTKERGLVIPSWAPQVPVLRHAATGGYVTHCGWNSVLESIVHGVPLIAWPLFAEQGTNAVLLTEDVKVALRPKEREDGVVQRVEVARVIKCLMEGEEGEGVQKKASELREAAARAREERGSSFAVLSEVVRIWNDRTKN